MLNMRRPDQAIGLYGAAILIACSRLYLMVHYATDVIAGAILGIVLGILISKFALALDKNLVCWPVVNVLDDLDICSLKIFRRKKPSHVATEFEQKYTVRKHKKPENKTDKIAKTALTVAVIVVFVASVGLQMQGVHGGFHQCEYKGNDYICMNKAKIKVQDNSGETHYYCDVHSSEATNVN